MVVIILATICPFLSMEQCGHYLSFVVLMILVISIVNQINIKHVQTWNCFVMAPAFLFVTKKMVLAVLIHSMYHPVHKQQQQQQAQQI